LFKSRYSHTKNCASCRRALSNIQKLKTSAAGIFVLTWGAIALLSVLLKATPTWAVISLTATFLISSVIWWRLNKFEQQFYLGKEIPPRNLPGKKK
jgi:hypothetical protein